MSKLLDGLNPAQQEAVRHTDGPLLILAGPGSGKTHTVARSIACAIEKCGVGPSRIAAFTFTNKAKDDLKKRISDNIVRQDLVDDIWIRTFHSFCGRVVKEDFDPFGIENERELTVKELILLEKERVRAEIDYIQHRNFPDPDDVLRFITQCQERNINSADVKDYVPHPQMADVYIDIKKKYEQLNDDGDPYTRVQLLTNALFRDFPEVRRKWQEKFDLIFVDEYQDTDQVQYKIIKALSERHQNLRVVGDDDQGIYGWRGADIQNILNFEKGLEKDSLKPKVILLGQNYRSTQRIVEASRALVEFNPDRREKDLFTRNFEGEKVIHLHCKSAEEQVRTITSFIIRAIRCGRSFKDFAVLCRLNNQVDEFKNAFNADEFKNVFKTLGIPADSVSVMTIHGAKGLEFPNVFVAGVCSGLLPYYKSKQEDWDEELRLLYVAMTRAKNWLCLSSYEKFPPGRSPFLSYIPSSLLKTIETLDNIPIPPKPEEMERSVTEEPSDYVEPLPEKLLGAGMTVIGVDPGNVGARKTNVGWSVTQKSADGYSVLCLGTENPVGTPENRLKKIIQKIDELIEEHSPAGIAVEKIEVGIEATIEDWFRYVAGCVATIGSIANQHGIECRLYTPQDVKYAATNDKNAKGKMPIQKGVMRICNLPQIPKPHHSADAIAASLCYLRSYLNSARYEGNKKKQERYEIGCNYLDQKRYEAALDEFKEAIKIDPIYTDAHCGLGQAHLERGELDTAKKFANMALQLDGNYPPACTLLDDIKKAYVKRGRYAFNKNNLTEAKKFAKEAYTLDKDYQPSCKLLNDIKQVYCKQGLAYIEAGEHAKAINFLLEASDIDLDDKQVWTNLGRAYYWIDDYVNAASCYRKATNIDPADKTAYANLGNACYWMEKYEMAVSSFQKARNIDQNCEKVLYYLARAYFKLGNLVEAEQAAKKALHIVPTYQDAFELVEDIEEKRKLTSTDTMVLILGGSCWIDKELITNAQYLKFVDSNPRWRKDNVDRDYDEDGDYLKHWDGNCYPVGEGDKPVVHVSWYAAKAYAQWVEKRLPTEAEWQAAELNSDLWEWCFTQETNANSTEPRVYVIDIFWSSPRSTRLRVGFRCARSITD